ncbi:hypothetical protein LEP1GSC158_1959 [Leptospira interrogans serovar Zanoni str. LT2156]|uniref:Uncharacterized protein n=1 Tax=Leptospira interrogans serovar Zanoni str. LT2156 TaxID=1001601 RepID=M6HCP0_LEPIR|nr:hypothetical protein LEP1GSC158_1959 [Leptospira interrogans serovar Zanoni str. LT2156]
MQLCLLFSGVLIFFLLSSYPSRLIKKGLLLILSLNLLLNIVNLFSAVHLIWPFNFLYLLFFLLMQVFQYQQSQSYPHFLR